MLLNKNDFENGLKQDMAFQKPQLGMPESVTVINAGKPNLFGAPQSLLSGGIEQYGGNPAMGGVSGIANEGKSKRDLLWEQKRKQKIDFISPPIPTKNEINNSGFGVPQQQIIIPQNNQGFQKAVSFEQPVILEMPSAPQPETFQKSSSNNALVSYQEVINTGPPLAPQPQIQPVSILKRDPVITQQQNSGGGVWSQVQAQTFMPLAQQIDSNVENQLPRVSGPPSDLGMQQQPFFNQPQNYPQFNGGYGFEEQPRLNSMNGLGVGGGGFSPFQQQPPQFPNNQGYSIPQNMPISQPSGQMGGYQSNQFAQQMSIQQPQPQMQIQVNSTAQDDKARKQKEYLQQIQNEIKEKEEKKRKEKEEKLKKEREELKQQLEYNPFGRGGAGAPLRDASGNIIVNRKPGEQQLQNPQMQQVSFNQPNYPNSSDFNNALQGFNQNSVPNYGNQGISIQPMNMNPYRPDNDIYAMNQQMPKPYQDDPYFSQNRVPMPPPEPVSNALPPRNSMQPVAQSGQPGLALGGFGEIEKQRKQSQKQELQNVLKQQMEEQKRRKEEEQRKKKEEEDREEDRIRRERQQLEEEFKMEEQKKKAKVVEFQQANANILQQKAAAQKAKVNDEAPNFIVEKPSKKREDLFGNAPAPLMQGEIKPQFEGFNNPAPVIGGPSFQLPIQQPMYDPFANNMPQGPSLYQDQMQQQAPQISQTRIIKDISSELKNNFREELDKLRQEMNSQQRAFRDQLQRLQQEASRQNNNKEETLKEIEKVKAELQKQNEKNRMQEQNLFTALDKYNPNKIPTSQEVLQTYNKPDSTFGNPPYQPTSIPMRSSSSQKSQRASSSRQEAREDMRKREINAYEKMFFNKPMNEEPVRVQPQILPQKNVANINNENYDIMKQQQRDFNRGPLPIKGIHDPNKLQQSFAGTLMGESELLPIDQNQRSFANNMNSFKQPTSSFIPVQDNQLDKQPSKIRPPSNYLSHLNQMGAADVRLETESAVDTMDFVNKIVNGVKSSKTELPSKQNSNLLKKDIRLAEKLDAGFDFNFPEIPPYEGIQTHLMGSLSKNDELPSMPNAMNSYLPKPDIFSKGYQNMIQQTPPQGETTNLSLGTLNSLNLDRINQKNDLRIAQLGDTSNLSINTFNQSPDIRSRDQNHHPNLPPRANSFGQRSSQNEQLKNMDNLLYDLLRSNDPAPRAPQPRIPSASSQGRLPHINQNNNYNQIQRMRDTRDQFIAPKMGQISEDDYEGTLKNTQKQGMAPLPSDMRRFDSLLGNTDSLALH